MIQTQQKEKEEFVESIKSDVEWLGAKWHEDVLFALKLFSTNV